jgi:hypothetical protein
MRTINQALWHFRLVILFIESVSCRFHEMWKSSTPAASTIIYVPEAGNWIRWPIKLKAYSGDSSQLTKKSPDA